MAIFFVIIKFLFNLKYFGSRRVLLCFLVCSQGQFVFAGESDRNFHTDLLTSKFRRADSIILGKYLGESYFLDVDDVVKTRSSFGIVRDYLRRDLPDIGEQLNRTLAVISDGGSWQGVKYTGKQKVDFEEGKSYLLFLADTPLGHHFLHDTEAIFSYNKDENGSIFLKEEGRDDGLLFSLSEFEYVANHYFHKLDGHSLFIDERERLSTSKFSANFGSSIYFLVIVFGILGGHSFIRGKKLF